MVTGGQTQAARRAAAGARAEQRAGAGAQRGQPAGAGASSGQANGMQPTSSTAEAGGSHDLLSLLTASTFISPRAHHRPPSHA